MPLKEELDPFDPSVWERMEEQNEATWKQLAVSLAQRVNVAEAELRQIKARLNPDDTNTVKAAVEIIRGMGREGVEAHNPDYNKILDDIDEMLEPSMIAEVQALMRWALQRESDFALPGTEETTDA